MSMSQQSGLFYGAFLNEDAYQAQDIVRKFIARGVFSDKDSVADAVFKVHWFDQDQDIRARYTHPITTAHGITYAHLDLVDGQPWDDYSLYFVGYPMDSKTLEYEEKLHPGITAAVDAELAQFAKESGLSIAPEVQIVTSWG